MSVLRSIYHYKRLSNTPQKAFIKKMVWITGQNQSVEFEEILRGFTVADYQREFPKMPSSIYYNINRIREWFFQNDHYGFLACLYFEKLDQKDSYHVRFVYEETTSKLITRLSNFSHNIYQQEIKCTQTY
jgi:hypothetical protein